MTGAPPLHQAGWLLLRKTGCVHQLGQQANMGPITVDDLFNVISTSCSVLISPYSAETPVNAKMVMINATEMQSPEPDASKRGTNLHCPILPTEHIINNILCCILIPILGVKYFIFDATVRMGGAPVLRRGVKSHTPS